MPVFGMDARGLSEYKGEPVFNWWKDDQLVSWNASREIPYEGQKIFWIAANIQMLWLAPHEIIRRAHNIGYYWIGSRMAVYKLQEAQVQQHEDAVLESCYQVEIIDGISSESDFIAHLELLASLGQV